MLFLATGAPLQVSKRKPVDRMLYALTICWLIQTVLMGTPGIHKAMLLHRLAPAPGIQQQGSTLGCSCTYLTGV